MTISRSIIRSAAYLNPIGHSFNLRPCLAAMRSTMRVVKSAHHFSGPFLADHQPLQENGKNLVRIHKAAILGHGANAISVAVGGQPGIGVLLEQGLLKHRYM